MFVSSRRILYFLLLQHLAYYNNINTVFYYYLLLLFIFLLLLIMIITAAAADDDTLSTSFSHDHTTYNSVAKPNAVVRENINDSTLLNDRCPNPVKRWPARLPPVI